MQGTSSEYRQKVVALADRVEDCLRGQPADLAMHALAMAQVSIALRCWEEPEEALTYVRERAANLLYKARRHQKGICPQGRAWIKKRATRRASESPK